MIAERTATEPGLEEYTQSMREDSFVALLKSVGVAGFVLFCGSVVTMGQTALALPVSVVLLAATGLANYVRKRES